MKYKEKLYDFLQRDYLGGFLLGVLLCFCLFLNFGLSPQKNFYDYQTFLSTMIVAAIGMVTVLVMKHQYNDAIYRKRLSMRAQMSDDIVALTDYAKECFNYVRNEETALPSPCSEAIKTFKNSIEFLDNQSSEAIYELVIFYQIHNSRLRGYKHDVESSQYQQCLFDAVKLHYLSLRVFEYARKEEEFITNTAPTREDMLSSLRSLIGHYRVHFPEEKYSYFVMIIVQQCKAHGL